MASPSRTTVALVIAVLLLGALALGACVLAAINDAQAHFLEKQRRRLTPTAHGMEVVQGSEAQAWCVHGSHAVRRDAVNA